MLCILIRGSRHSMRFLSARLEVKGQREAEPPLPCLPDDADSNNVPRYTKHRMMWDRTLNLIVRHTRRCRFET